MFYKKEKDFKRHQSTQSFGDALNLWLESVQLKGKYQQSNLINNWEQLVGPSIANRTLRLFFKNDTLYVYLNSSSLKHQLQLKKEEFIQHLNTKTNSNVVKNIVFN
jgi:predicted nucleic acid-binding Zn ribbon protein